MAFEEALRVVLQNEGGFTEDPADPGGATNQGVTQRAYDDYRGRVGRPKQSVRLMTDRERDDLYYEDYWVPSHAKLLTGVAQIFYFDTAVLFGPEGAIKILQTALGVTVDGLVGPQTTNAARQAGDWLAEELLWTRLEAHWSKTRDEAKALTVVCRQFREGAIPDKGLVNKAEGMKFLRWWMKRIFDLREGPL